MTAGVVDGVTVGHPCCSVHDCKVPLARQTNRFCPQHYSLNSLCCVRTCHLPSADGFCTCDIPEHRQLEAHADATNKAMFQLRRRAAQSSTEEPDGAPSAADPVLGQDPEVEPSLGTPKLKASFSRKWTHNEQLFVRCCCIITSRATFYGSEAITGVAVCHPHLTNA